MASSDDYVGIEFGSFLVESILGSGREAEVFQVCNRETGRRYAMRLDASDDAIWEGDPIIPPRNFSLEAKNVRGSWFATLQYEKLGRNRDGWLFQVPRIFGVRDLTYLVPVSSPFSLRGSISIEEFLAIAPADDLHLFETWEDIVLAMLGDAHAANEGRMSENAWQRRWKVLLGGEILQVAIAQYMMAGYLSKDERGAILDRIGASDGLGRELAYNLLLRLCGTVSRGRVSLEAATQTARDKFFRENITRRELDQIVACWTVLTQIKPDPTTSLFILGQLLSALKDQPPLRHEQPAQFEEAPGQDFHTFIERHRLSRFSLFLQELAGVEQPFATLGAAS